MMHEGGIGLGIGAGTPCTRAVHVREQDTVVKE